MRDYFRMTQETAHLTRVLCAALEEHALAEGGVTAGRRKPAVRSEVEGFPLRGNRLDLPAPKILDADPAEIIRLFRVAQVHDLDIHPDAWRRLRRILPRLTAQLRRNTHAYACFMDILCDARRCTRTLRWMNEATVLLALFEDFRNIHTHMQYDMHHTVTADEHTIRACGMLHDIAAGVFQDQAPLATSLMPALAMPRILFLAMFLHDMAKGSGHDHTTAGGDIARKTGPLFALDPAETALVAWLVENHLLMTATAFRRDLEDIKTIADFAAAVQSPERLKMLEVMTVADIMAVGPEVWNGWKGGLLRQLYHKTHAQLTGAATRDGAAPLPAAFDAPLPYIEITQDHGDGLTRLLVAAEDSPGLFSTLAGAIAAAGASIVQARIHTLPDGIAVDVFELQDARGRAFDNDAFLTRMLRQALAGRLDIPAALAERRRQQPRPRQKTQTPPQVIIDNSASHLHTLVEIRAADRPGLLYDITACLAAEGLNIHAAKAATFGTQAADVFYVKDAFGLKIIHPDRLASLEKALMMGLAKPAPASL
jgi:[protein-PII] uridylyltransferase